VADCGTPGRGERGGISLPTLNRHKCSTPTAFLPLGGSNLPWLAGRRRRASVAVLDEQVRPFSIHLRVRGLQRVKTVDVAVVHAEGCRDEDGVVDLEVGRTFGPRRVDV
jgi:hypothetical protein